jgi:hypothetical protein
VDIHASLTLGLARWRPFAERAPMALQQGIDKKIAPRRSFTSAAFVQDDSKKGSPAVILSVSEGSPRSDGSFCPHLSKTC